MTPGAHFENLTAVDERAPGRPRRPRRHPDGSRPIPPVDSAIPGRSCVQSQQRPVDEEALELEEDPFGEEGPP